MQKQNKWNRSKQEKLIRYTYRQKNRDIFVIKEENDKKAQNPNVTTHTRSKRWWVSCGWHMSFTFGSRLTSECNATLYWLISRKPISSLHWSYVYFALIWEIILFFWTLTQFSHHEFLLFHLPKLDDLIIQHVQSHEQHKTIQNTHL